MLLRQIIHRKAENTNAPLFPLDKPEPMSIMALHSIVEVLTMTMQVQTVNIQSTALADSDPDTLLPVQERCITGEALFAMGDIGRAELVKGEIVPLMPTGFLHAIIESRVARLLGNFVDTHDMGYVLTGEAGIYTQRDPDTVRGMDVAYISKERLAQTESQSFLDVAPELVVEVISPDDRWIFTISCRNTSGAVCKWSGSLTQSTSWYTSIVPSPTSLFSNLRTL
jgi:hypothetical protein